MCPACVFIYAIQPGIDLFTYGYVISTCMLTYFSPFAFTQTAEHVCKDNTRGIHMRVIRDTEKGIRSGSAGDHPPIMPGMKAKIHFGNIDDMALMGPSTR